MNITEFLKKTTIPFTIYETYIEIGRYLNLYEFVDVDKTIDVKRNLYVSKAVQFNCIINVQGSFYGHNNTLQPGTYIGRKLHTNGLDGFNTQRYMEIYGYLMGSGILS